MKLRILEERAVEFISASIYLLGIIILFLGLIRNEVGVFSLIIFWAITPVAVFVLISHLLLTARLSRPVSSLVALTLYAIYIIETFASSYLYFGLRQSSAVVIIHDGLTSLYFSILVFLTQGYGDYVPINGYGRIVAEFEVVCGYLVSGIFLAIMILIFTRASAVQENEKQG